MYRLYCRERPLMNRRGFLKGVFAGAALAVLPKLNPSPAGASFIPPETPVRWTQMIYGEPILFMPKKSIHFISIEATISTPRIAQSV